MNDNYYCSLADYGVVHVTGSDAAAFLQDHFCNDIDLLAEHDTQLTGYCTPKGRLLAILTVLRLQQDYYLVMHRSVVASVIKRLSMFAMMPRPAGKESGGRMVRTDVALTDASDALAIIGLSGTAIPSDIRAADGVVGTHEQSHWYQHDAGGERVIYLVADDRADELRESLRAAGVGHAPDSMWELADIRAGFPQITAATQESVVPQMANMHSLNAVSFKKGCYPGQEIVARMQYLGTLKRIMQRFRVSVAGAKPGDTLVDADQKEVGLILRVAPSDSNDEQEMLAVIRTSALERLKPPTNASASTDSLLRLAGDESARIEWLPLPYHVPTEGNQ